MGKPKTHFGTTAVGALFALACAAAGLFPGSAWSASPEKVRLQLKWYHQFQFAGYYAARSREFYRDENLDVEIIEGAKDRSPVDVVLKGQAEFGVHDGGDLIYRRMKGDPLIAVAAVFQHSPYVIVSMPASGIRHPADLIGRTVLIAQEQGNAQILAMFQREGVKVNSPYDREPVRFAPQTANFADLIEKRADAMVAYVTDVPRFKSIYGFEPAVLNPLEYGIDFYGDALFTSGEYLNAHPEVVARFRRASQKGWQYAMANKAEMADVIQALSSSRPTRPTRQALLDEARAMDGIILPTLVEVGNMNTGRWEKMAKAYQQLGMIASTGNLDGFSYAVDFEKQEIKNRLQILGFVLVGITILAVISLIWVRVLRATVRVRTIELANDIRERKVAEAKLAQLNAELEMRVATRTAELETTIQQLGAFSYTVAHDLRAPLRAVNGFSEIVLKDNEGKLDESSVSNLKRIVKGSKRMGVLIDDLLNLTRLSNQELQPRDIDLSEMAARVVASLVDADAGRCVAVTIQPDMIARGDPGLLRIVLENLIGNAWKFTVKTSAAKIDFGAEFRDGRNVYYVRDNGAGFDMAYAHKLFAPFQRLHHNDEFEGTGIGLVTVKKIIQRHGGDIWAESVVSLGTTMLFTLGAAR